MKNWKKIENRKEYIAFQGADGDKVTVAKPKHLNKWIMGAHGQLHVKTANNKRQAMSFATKYMKSHQKG